MNITPEEIRAYRLGAMDIDAEIEACKQMIEGGVRAITVREAQIREDHLRLRKLLAIKRELEQPRETKPRTYRGKRRNQWTQQDVEQAIKDGAYIREPDRFICCG